MADPGIEDGVEQIDDEVHDDEAGANQQHHALQDDEVAREDRADQQRPMPGSAKIVSTMTAPPIKRPILMPVIVTSVSDDGFSACTNRMRAGVRPLALASAI